jgi:transcriptional regulator with XRE-family HTH domain
VKKEIVRTKLGTLIRKRRLELGIGQAELARLLGLHRQFVYQIEMGISSMTSSPETLEKIARILKLPVGKLIAVKSKRKLTEIKNTPTAIGSLLYRGRLKLNMSRRDLCRISGVSLLIIQNLEIGRKKTLNSKISKKLSEALACVIPTSPHNSM